MANGVGHPLVPSQSAPSNRVRYWTVRVVAVITAGTLVTAVALLLSAVHHFALTRFFTIDEYQWGHATWLVSVGQVPYRDFYEHHLPLGYILHSWILPEDASFIERALMLRRIAFAYALAGSASVAIAEYIATRNVFTAALCAIVPISVGFGLMSAIDYRGDNWSAFIMVCCFSMLRVNQLVRRRWLAALAGVFFTIALLMTQKTLVIGGVALLLMLAFSVWRTWAPRPRRWHARLTALEIHDPGTFAVAAALPLLIALGAGAWAGVLSKAFEITVEQAWQHEQWYPGFSAWRYIQPYFAHAPLSTGALVACALGYAALSTERFWVLPTAAALLGGLSPKAPFPYNLVLGSFLIGVCAVRGYAEALQYVARRWPSVNGLIVIGYLIPLLLVPAQVGFVEETTTNEGQLGTLRLIETHTTSEDIVIDNEGSALFRPHRGYYWYHGKAHVQMFRDYYDHAFVNDLRSTRAIFWINSVRSTQLPIAARRYLEDHYVRVRGDLCVLGFTFPRNELDHSAQQTFDVVREGDYFVACLENAVGSSTAFTSEVEPRLLIDGEALKERSIYLDTGQHQVEIEAASPGCRLTYLPAATFATNGEVGRHAPLFEYKMPL
jgi:hypothetical protein